jgi:hypothetical protein
MIFDINKELRILGLQSGRAQPIRAWRLPLNPNNKQDVLKWGDLVVRRFGFSACSLPCRDSGRAVGASSQQNSFNHLSL